MNRSRLSPAIAAVLSGLLLVCAYPPLHLGFMAWFALIPLVGLIGVVTPGRLYAWSFVSGCTFLGGSLYWLGYHPSIPWVVAALIIVVLAAIYAIPFWLTGLVVSVAPGRGLWTLPFFLAAIEWIRTFDQLAFPWMALGNSQSCYPWLIQFADITSVFGVSAWVAAMNVALLFLVRGRTPARAALVFVLVAAPVAYSRAVIATGLPDTEPLTVAMIQGNVIPEDKWSGDLEEWNVNLYRSMSIEAAAAKPGLFVWPETAIPFYILAMDSFRPMVQSLVDSTGIPLLTGLPTIDLATGETWNSAGLFLPHQAGVARYDKMHLVPVGESFPYDDVFPWLRRIDLGQANWARGREPVVFHPPGLPPMCAAICFESIFPDLMRRFITRGARVIVIITNDVWFGPSASPVQHAMIAAMRAVEFHRPVVRCANTGVSMFIDQYGRVKDRTGMFERTMLTGSVTPDARMTFYARFGNLFGHVSCAVSLAALVMWRVRSRVHVSPLPDPEAS